MVGGVLWCMTKLGTVEAVLASTLGGWRMNRWGLMSTVAVALAVGWGVVLTAPGVAYAEMTLPEERLCQ